MQKELQITLTIIGILVIGGVLLHGMWTNRKNAEKLKKARFEPRNWDGNFDPQSDIKDEQADFDEVGVGKARVVASRAETKGFDPLAINTQTATTSGIVDDPLLSGLAGDENTSSDHTLRQNKKDEEQYDNFSNYAKYVKDERNDASKKVSTDAVPSTHENIGNAETNPVGEAKDNHNSELSTHNDSPEVGTSIPDKQAQAPIYSNVVTQRKPNFNKPPINSDDESFGEPPRSLRKPSFTPTEDSQDSAQTTKLASEHPNVPVGQPNRQTVYKTAEDDDTSLNEPPIVVAKESLTSAVDEPNASNVPPQSTPHTQANLSIAEQAKRFVRRNKQTVAEKIRKEPLVNAKDADDQMRIDFDESQSLATSASSPSKDTLSDAAQSKQSTSPKANKAVAKTDVLVLNVRAADDNPISGASLLPMLLTLGFKFGEHDIFHRHVNTNGKGPILFSLTNMFKPGVFDIDNIENFSTHGLSLFMMLPIDGEPQQVFNMMHNAARKISEEFGCRLLDGNKVGLSKQSLQHYIERIREFERRRISQ